MTKCKLSHSNNYILFCVLWRVPCRTGSLTSWARIEMPLFDRRNKILSQKQFGLGNRLLHAYQIYQWKSSFGLQERKRKKHKKPWLWTQRQPSFSVWCGGNFLAAVVWRHWGWWSAQIRSDRTRWTLLPRNKHAARKRCRHSSRSAQQWFKCKCTVCKHYLTCVLHVYALYKRLNYCCW